MNILGISCHSHDAAACLLRDGEVAAAAQEERFTRTRGDPAFPIRAINSCLQAGGLTARDLDHVAFYEKPFLKFARTVVSHLRAWPFSLGNFLETMPSWIEDRLSLSLVVRDELSFEGAPLFVRHHLSHAASAFLPSPFEEAAILTADGAGEWATTACAAGRGREIRPLREIRFPDSLGLLYAAATQYLGFEPSGGEDAVMGLAGHGKPRCLDAFRRMAAVRPDGSYRLDPSYFSFGRGGRLYGPRLAAELGPERTPGEELRERHCDVAASLQAFVEETLLVIARRLREETRSENLCLAGGLFLNCAVNRRLLEDGPFREVFVQPCAGDGGGALGAAAYVYHCALGNGGRRPMRHAFLGPSFPPARIQRALQGRGLAFKKLDEAELLRSAADALARGRVVGWFQGRMEFGPRALGGRSILADPRDPAVKGRLDSKVKGREPLRPYAAAVPEERAAEFFDAKGFSPFMTLTARVRAEKRALLPAVTHADGTVRVQAVRRAESPRFWGLLQEFASRTGTPVLLNTSFRLPGEPIVCSPEDALDCFREGGLDLVALDDFAAEAAPEAPC